MEGSNVLSRKRKDSAASVNQEKTGGRQAEKLDQRSRIAVAAYYKAEARGFKPGHDVDDWLLAEAEEKNEQFA